MIQGLDLLVALSFCGVILAAAISFYLYKIYQVSSDISQNIKDQICKINNLNSSIENIEFAITGTSQSVKKAQDYVRENFSSGTLRTDNTSLRDYLERSKSAWKDIAELNVELKHFREIWEFTHQELKTKPSFNELKLSYISDQLNARGIYGEAHDRYMRRYRKYVWKVGSED